MIRCCLLNPSMMGMGIPRNQSASQDTLDALCREVACACPCAVSVANSRSLGTLLRVEVASVDPNLKVHRDSM